MPAQTTTAVTVQPDMSPYPVTPEKVVGVGSFVGAVIMAVLYMRRRLPKDKLEALKDRTEGLMLNEARADREKAMADAREAWSQLNAMQRTFGELKAENGYLKEQLRVNLELVTEMRRGVQNVGRTVDTVKGHMEETTKRVGSSGITPLEGKP